MELSRYKTLSLIHPLIKVIFFHSMGISASYAVELENTTDSDLISLNLNHSSNDSFHGQDLYLDVKLNGAYTGISHFYYDEDQLWADVTILRQLGFILPDGLIDPVRLNSLPGLQVNYNKQQQAVDIIAPLTLLNLNKTVIDTRENKGQKASASPGILLNYNLYGTQSDHHSTSLNAFTEIRAFNALGVLSSTALSNGYRSNDEHNKWNKRTVRLDTYWSTSFPEQMITFRAGDILSSALSWTRSTRLGGLQIGTNFDLQPYRITTPLSSFFGSATLPSAVELYINGLKQYSGEVPAGPFEINTSPSFSGIGDAQLVLTDALGQNTTLNFSLYNTHRLLQPGLSDWSLELGAIRENYGLASFDYGKNPIGSGTWRYGVNRFLSTETHAELGKNLTNAGIGSTWLLGNRGGIFFISLAGSEHEGQSGTQYTANYSWNNDHFHININNMETFGDYRDVASQYGNISTRRHQQFSTGYSAAYLGSLGLSYNKLNYAQENSTEFASIYWAKSLGQRLNLNFNYNYDISDSKNNSASLGATISLERNKSVSAHIQQMDQRYVTVVDALQSIPSAGGLGWRAQAQNTVSDNIDSNQAGLFELSYLGRYGQLQGGISSRENNFSTYANATGSLVLMGRGIFATRQINNGFAVVSTQGIGDVPVLLQNNRIGMTNSRGLLLVSPLSAYHSNKISIDPMDLAADLYIDTVDIEAIPTDRAGILVNFNIKPVSSASIILHDVHDQPLATGSQVYLSSKKDKPSGMVGFDGEVYLEVLDQHNILKVITPSKEICTASFDYLKQNDDIPLIGPLVCQQVAK